MNYNSNAQYMPNAVAFAPDYVRAEFIRKVYHYLFASLLLTVGVGYASAQATPVMLPLLMPLLLVGFVVGLVMAFARKTSGLNIAMLFSGIARLQNAPISQLLVTNSTMKRLYGELFNGLLVRNLPLARSPPAAKPASKNTILVPTLRVGTR